MAVEPVGTQNLITRLRRLGMAMWKKSKERFVVQSVLELPMPVLTQTTCVLLVRLSQLYSRSKNGSFEELSPAIQQENETLRQFIPTF